MNVIPVIVTYGDRWRYLSLVLQAVAKSPFVTELVLVLNGPTGISIEQINIAAPDVCPTVIAVRSNEGSAGGFARGLAAAVGLGSKDDLVLMLDDDNVPADDAIAHLIEYAGDPAILGGLLMARLSRPDIRRSVESRRPIVEARNSFAAFSLSAAIAKRLPVTGSRSSDSEDVLIAEYAPYGGLALSISSIEAIGLPRRDYVLYSDDHEYSYRITQSGGEIRIVPSALLEDLEESWHLGRSTLLPWFDPASSDMRVYFTLRNRVDYERRSLVSNSAIRALNMVGFCLIGLLDSSRCIVRDREMAPTLRRVQVIRGAIRDGRLGTLGIGDWQLPSGTGTGQFEDDD